MFDPDRKEPNKKNRHPISPTSSPDSKSPRARLLVDEAISLLLLAVLEQDGRGEDDRRVDPDDAECARENDVEEETGVFGEGADAPDLGGGDLGVGTDVVDDEGGGSAVRVAAAFELDIVSGL